MRTFLYRVLEVDKSGDPLDFGVVQAPTHLMAIKEVHTHLCTTLPDDIYTVRLYDVPQPKRGVWQSTALTDHILDLSQPQ